MASVWGENIKLDIFGESHGEAIGAVLHGLPAGEEIDTEALEAFLARRAPGSGAHVTARRETDLPKLVSGLYGGRTTGAPLAAVIENTGARSGDYSAFENLPRPGHADYTAYIKYGGSADMRGGGHFSGRLTAAFCLAGGLCLQIIKRRGVTVGAHILAIGNERDELFDPVSPAAERILAPGRSSPLAVINPGAGDRMLALIESAAAAGDSLGGVVECCVLGLPAGLGGPLFEGVENKLAQLLFAIPAVKAVEFGAGFALAGMRGSEANDAFVPKPDGRLGTRGNNCGGILGGITNGMPLIVRAGFKPTPSISIEQESVNLKTGERERLRAGGRHDPCVVPRAVPCVEAAAALAALDLILDGQKYGGVK